MKQTTKVSRSEVRWGQRQQERTAPRRLTSSSKTAEATDTAQSQPTSLNTVNEAGGEAGISEYEILQQGVNRALRELGSFVHQRYPRDVVLHARVRALTTALERLWTAEIEMLEEQRRG